GLLARVLGGDLRRIRGRLAAALEAHHPGRAPRDGIALRVGDGDHRIVEAGVHVGDAGGDVLALPSAKALRCLSHVVVPVPKSKSRSPWGAEEPCLEGPALLLLAR